MILLLLSSGVTVSSIEWQSAAHIQKYGSRFKNVKSFNWGASDQFVKIANNASDASECDIYQFGVYTGGTMKAMHRKIKSYRKMWGFDSFQGLPEEIHGLHIEGKHWLAGAFSSKGALKYKSATGAMNHVKSQLVGNNELVMGFFNESLPRMDIAQTRKALVVDIDSDLYISAIQALEWLFKNNIAMSGTLFRYDDWNSGDQSWGEPKAHSEITKQCNVIWKQISINEFQVQTRDNCKSLNL
jgi:hypothetical protein